MWNARPIAVDLRHFRSSVAVAEEVNIGRAAERLFITQPALSRQMQQLDHRQSTWTELVGQTVVLIGGSAGIGLQTAKRARAEGADVILTGRNPERLQAVAGEVGALSTAAFDAADLDALDAFFQSLEAPIDHVLVTAGRPPYYGRRDSDLFGEGVGVPRCRAGSAPRSSAASRPETRKWPWRGCWATWLTVELRGARLRTPGRDRPSPRSRG
jgi:hypothetical protein